MLLSNILNANKLTNIITNDNIIDCNFQEKFNANNKNNANKIFNV